MRLLIAYKILFIGLVGVIGILINILFNYQVSESNRISLSNISNLHIPIVDNINHSILKLKQIKGSLTIAVSTGEVELIGDIEELQNPLEQGLFRIAEIDASYKEYIDKSVIDLRRYILLATEVSIKIINEEEFTSVEEQMILEMNDLYNELLGSLEESRHVLSNRFSDVVEEASVATKRSIYINLFIAVISAVIIFITALAISKSISTTIQRVISSMKKLTEENSGFESRIENKTSDEIGDLVKCFNSFVVSMSKIFIKIEQEKWLKTGIAELNANISDERDTTQFGDRVLQFMANYISANIGCFYIKKHSEEQDFYQLVSSYGCNGEKELLPKFSDGEGVIGQATFDKEVKIIDDVPGYNINVKTATIKSDNLTVVIIPLLFQNSVIAVIEFAFLSRLSKDQKLFIKASLEPISQRLYALTSRINTEKLLVKTQKQTDELESTHKKMTDSINYASLIQHSIIPEEKEFKSVFTDYFTLWTPRDVIGGDIYLFSDIPNRHEYLLMVIDCTGHGVPGAFVTMLVKAIERQIIGKISQDPNIKISPGWILGYFNKTLKKLLHQEDSKSVSNAGFDGGVLLYNKDDNSIKYAGAELPLMYIQNGQMNQIKGDRQSVGYRTSDTSFIYKEHDIKIDQDTFVYLTTDGYIDQNGGAKMFPFGKKKLQKALLDIYQLPFNEQKNILIEKNIEYKKSEETTDDLTVIGLKFCPS
ncbi:MULTISPECIES: SpoIIE family protein phosphatase [unclassified Pseudoalteromonas]|uniref:SpoIIE family protein phosphatase n=1 Tax=unclassified Pseudoalteromonas TaxID=194690 RepID=UPI0005A8D27D|nr:MULTISPECIES: SpoIIE family protein phosphatase [unclassified Pseudoalteromonas]